MGSAVLVGGLATGGRAVQTRPARGLHLFELGAASGAGGWQLDSALNPDRSVSTALLRLLPFAEACGLVGVDLAEQHDHALPLCPHRGVRFVAIDRGELLEHALVERRERHGGFEQFGFVA